MAVSERKKGTVMEKREKLTEELIRKENPHFGPKIRVIEEGSYESKCGFDFDYFITVGAQDSKIDMSLEQDGSEVQIVDAHATFLWSPKERRWVLGAN
jgi:Fe-S cluster assembly iron-binding protein IscA